MADDAREEEIEVLRAMYCEDGEFVASPDDPFAFEICLREGDFAINLKVKLPSGYPECRPDLLIQNNVLSEDDVDELMRGMMTLMDERGNGELVMSDVLEWLKEHGPARVAAATENARLRNEAARREDLVHGQRCVMWLERGDLFDVGSEWALCHCVARDFKMDAGTAAKVKKIYGGLDDYLDGNFEVGGVVITNTKGRLVYHLITKRIAKGKTTMDKMESALRAMKEHMVRMDIKKVALPQIGCGSDQLSWSAVRSLILQVFDDADVEIMVRC